MAYDTEPVPAGSDPNVTFENLNENADLANTYFGVDHVAFNAGGSNQGQHSKLTFPNGIAAPGAAGTQQILFPNSGSSQLRLSVQTASEIVDITNILTTTVGTAPFQLTRMPTPWGIILYYGIVTISTGLMDYTISTPNENPKYASIDSIGSVTTISRVKSTTSGAGGNVVFQIGSLSTVPTNFSVIIITEPA